MRTVEYVCDRCGRTADGAVSVYWYQLPLRQSYDLTVCDLCPECAKELRSWLETRETKEEDNPWRTTHWAG